MSNQHTQKIEEILRRHFDSDYEIKVNSTIQTTVAIISHRRNLSKLVISPDSFQTVGVWLLDVNLIHTIQSMLLNDYQKALYNLNEFPEIGDLTEPQNDNI